MPDTALCLCGRVVELYLVEEAAFESLVEVGGEVGGGNHDAFKLLHFLQNDVLDGIVHLIHRVVHIGDAFAENSVGLIEEQDGRILHTANLFAVWKVFYVRLYPEYHSASDKKTVFRCVRRHCEI